MWSKSKGIRFCICGCVLQPSTHLQCMCWCSLSKSLMHFISVGLIEPPCLVVFYSSTALLLAPSSCSMKRERGSHVSQLCSSGPALWEEELLLFKALCGFCFFMWRWEEVDLQLCQASCCLCSLPIAEGSGQ